MRNPIIVPSGTFDSSPAIYRWVEVEHINQSPVGTAEPENDVFVSVVPTGLRFVNGAFPSDKSLGYFQSPAPQADHALEQRERFAHRH